MGECTSWGVLGTDATFYCSEMEPLAYKLGRFGELRRKRGTLSNTCVHACEPPIPGHRCVMGTAGEGRPFSGEEWGFRVIRQTKGHECSHTPHAQRNLSMPRGNKQTLMLAVFLKNIQRRALRMPSWELWYSLVGTPTERVFSSELLGAVLFRRQSTVFSGM